MYEREREEAYRAQQTETVEADRDAIPVSVKLFTQHGSAVFLTLQDINLLPRLIECLEGHIGLEVWRI